MGGNHGDIYNVIPPHYNDRHIAQQDDPPDNIIVQQGDPMEVDQDHPSNKRGRDNDEDGRLDSKRKRGGSKRRKSKHNKSKHNKSKRRKSKKKKRKSKSKRR